MATKLQQKASKKTARRAPARSPPMEWEAPQGGPEASEESPVATRGQPIDFMTASGEHYRIGPGPYGKGISVVPVPAGTAAASQQARARNAAPVQDAGKRGRKPAPSTVALRQKLEHDNGLKAGLKAPPEYVRWLIDQDPGMGTPMARTIVYRELKPYK